MNSCKGLEQGRVKYRKKEIGNIWSEWEKMREDKGSYTRIREGKSKMDPDFIQIHLMLSTGIKCNVKSNGKKKRVAVKNSGHTGLGQKKWPRLFCFQKR